MPNVDYHNQNKENNDEKYEYYFLRMHVYKWAGKIGVINYNNEAFVHEI